MALWGVGEPPCTFPAFTTHPFGARTGRRPSKPPASLYFGDSQRLKTMGVLPFAPSILGRPQDDGTAHRVSSSKGPPKPTSPTAVRNTAERDSEIAAAAEKAWRECLDIDPALYLAQLINLRGPGRTHPSHAARASRFAVSRFAIWPQVASVGTGVISS
jgi:hypothetical protein